MINVKRFFTSYATGATLTLTVERLSDETFLQTSDGSFANTPDQVPMSETMPGGYSLNESRTLWTNGLYDVVFYDGGTVINGVGFEFQVAQDQIMNGIALVALAAKNATSQVAGALKLIQTTVESVSKNVSILAGQVNDFSSQTRRVNGQ